MMAALIQTADQLAVILKDSLGGGPASGGCSHMDPIANIRSLRMPGLSPGILDNLEIDIARVLEEANVMIKQTGI